jgi:hypothetical protein
MELMKGHAILNLLKIPEEQIPTSKYQYSAQTTASSGFEMTSVSCQRGLVINCVNGTPPSHQSVTLH